jgi:hypothetical protein
MCHVRVNCFTQSEISNLRSTSAVNQDITRLQITMKNPRAMQK